MRIQAISAMVFLAVAGCAADGPDQEEDALDWRSGDGKQDGETCEFESMSAETYYRQFDYKAIMSPSGNTRYRVGLTFNVQATLPNGDDADLDVYFLRDDRVIVEYSEERHSSGSQWDVLNETILITRKRLDQSTRAIAIDGLGVGTPVTVRNASGECLPGINFKFTGDLRSPGLTDTSTEIIAGLTSARVIDPDNLQDLSETMRRWFEEDVASGKIVVIRK
jgi:hypothetical protein